MDLVHSDNVAAYANRKQTNEFYDYGGLRNEYTKEMNYSSSDW